MLKIDNLHFSYGAHPVISGLDLTISDGEHMTLVGPSGAGKSTMLKLIMGSLIPRSGRIEVAGNVMTHPFIRPEKRPVTLLSQDDTLFPHLKVKDNLLFGAKKKSSDLLNTWLEALDIVALKNRYPSELSGGEIQRVMLGRALIYGPKLILLDEPFKGLDDPLKKSLMTMVQTLFKAEKITVLLATHDLHVAKALTGPTVTLTGGRIQTP